MGNYCCKKQKENRYLKVKERVDKELERFQIEQVQPEEFLRKYDGATSAEDIDFMILDVRNPGEIETVCLDFTNQHGVEIPQIRFPFAKLKTSEEEVTKLASQLPRDKRIYCFCYYGVRSNYTCQRLLPYTDIDTVNVELGFAGLNKLNNERFPLY